MTSVNVTTQANTVTVTDSSGSTVVSSPVTTVVTASTVGPQGGTGEGIAVDDAAKVDKSIVYYDGSSGKFLADATWTTDTLVLGGNF
jgi:hypothetical protein|tara:strand:- start:1809 stop:2069 length:261 start_codon:yes stop_codon:yes gene_type:complete